MNQDPVPITHINKKIAQMAHVDSEYVSTEEVTERWKGKTIWSGPVHKFRLYNHPTSNYCYAFVDTKREQGRLKCKVDVMPDLGKEQEKPVSALDAVRVYLLKKTDKKGKEK